jgi:predicted RNA-binding Zn-ribbon protein involved in translation (DUF1610 family)
MTLKEFREYCNKHDDNISGCIPEWKFKFACGKCGSGDISIMFHGKEVSCGSELTGCWTTADNSLVFKCRQCGNAHGIIDRDDTLKDRE